MAKRIIFREAQAAYEQKNASGRESARVNAASGSRHRVRMRWAFNCIDIETDSPVLIYLVLLIRLCGICGMLALLKILYPELAGIASRWFV